MKLKTVKALLWFFLGIGTITGAARFLFGLGATTNLTDTTPWGIWIGFDVMGGVALAAGGFVLAGSVYILRLERYRPIVRAAVLTAFLGYLAVAVGLLFDLGLPWNIWHLIIFWNPHSPLFEVGWCVMLYLTILLLEFSPVVLEKIPALESVCKALKKAALPLVVLGIMLSTLHQSSLGSLMLIMPFRLHPLWYSPILPVMFLVSAVGLGLAMVIFEATVTGWLYDREHETDLLSGLGKAASVVLGFYIVLKLVDLAVQGKFGFLFQHSWETWIYWLELILSAALPAALLSRQRIRNSKAGLLSSATLVVIGFVWNRINVSGIATIRATGTDYVPSLIEISISLWVVSAAVLVFLFFVEHFKVWEEEAGTRDALHAPPVFEPVSQTWNDETFYGSVKRHSLVYAMGAALALMLLPQDARTGAQPVVIPVQRARIADKLVIDGNRSGMAVSFDHDLHKQKNGETESCRLCHHMRKPLDKTTPCADCHRDMQRMTYIFDHDLHREKLQAQDGCVKCHENTNLPKTFKTVTDCETCHTDMRLQNSVIKVDEKTPKNYAGGYQDAMHGLCITCHTQKKEELKKPRHDECATCHRDLPKMVIAKLDTLYGRLP
jgi:Ni/Fe-hydrogenase subunit HybB-like protein